MIDSYGEELTPVQLTLQNELERAVFGVDTPAAEEAVARYRVLAKVAPAIYAYPLARAQVNLGCRLARLGRVAEALTYFGDANIGFQRLLLTNPDHDAEFVDTLYNLGVALREFGDPERSLQVTQQALDAYREREHTRPGSHRSDIAASLHNLGNIQTILGMYPQAVLSFEEAIPLFRTVAHENPNYAAQFASLLVNYGSALLPHLGRLEDGLAAVEQGIAMLRAMEDAGEPVEDPQLGVALQRLGVLLTDADRRDQALSALGESVVLLRQQVLLGSDTAREHLAVSLTELSTVLREVGHDQDGAVAASEAITILRTLAASGRDVHRVTLVEALTTAAYAHAKADRHEAARVLNKEATEICRALVAADPAKHAPRLIVQLGLLAANTLDVGVDLVEAIAVAQEAIDRTLDLDDQPSGGSSTLLNLGFMFAALLEHRGYAEDAQAAVLEPQWGLWGAMARTAHRRGDTDAVERWVRAAVVSGRSPVEDS